MLRDDLYDHMRSFQGLREAELIYYGLDGEILSQVLAFPRLQSLTGYINIEDGALSIPARCSMRSMLLETVSFPEATLRALIPSCPELQSFGVTLKWLDLVSHHGSGMQWDDVVSTLDSHVDLLTHLKLDIETPPEDAGPMEPIGHWSWPMSISTLRSFTRLSHLEIHQSAFLNLTEDGNPLREPLADVLPPSLQVLRILCFDGGLLPQLDALIVTLPHSYPLLSRVEVKLGDFCQYDVTRSYPPHNLVRSAEEHLDRVYNDFRRLGIEFIETA